MAAPTPVPEPLVEPGQPDWDDDPRTCRIADDRYWDNRYDTDRDED